MSNATDSEPKPNNRPAIKRLVRLASKLAVIFGTVAVWLWCVGFACFLDDHIPNWIAWGLAVVITVGIPILFFRFRRRRPLVPLIGLAVVWGCTVLGSYLIKPSHDRDWGLTQSSLPYVDHLPAMFGGTDTVVVGNIRSNRYGPVAPDRGLYYDDVYDLSKLESVWFGVDRFTDIKPLAHTFLSFGFEPGTHKSNYLAFSVETRREKDELTYSPIRGFFQNYEIIYVIADEQDALSGRSDTRENIIQLYPVRATREQAREMFLDMLNRANSIREEPEFYHTITNNCTNNIVYHTNKVLETPISAWQRGVMFPGYADWLAYRLGIIDTELSLDEARKQFRIDQRVKEFDGKSDFSEFIRGR